MRRCPQGGQARREPTEVIIKASTIVALVCASVVSLAACGEEDNASSGADAVADGATETVGDPPADVEGEVDTAAGTPCEGQMDLSDEDGACVGNVGCAELGVECGMCVCVLCWNEDCLVSACDDGGSDECPGSPWNDDGDVGTGIDTETAVEDIDDAEAENEIDVTVEVGVEDATEVEDAPGPTPDAESAPTLPPEGTCSAEQACDPSTGSFCVQPDFPMCGTCMDPDIPCEDDTDCQDSLGVCEPNPYPCPCDPSIWGCTAPCESDDGCDGVKVCDGGGHCVMPSCGQDGDCPANHGCVEGSCARDTCAHSSECDDWCVLGSCYDFPGTCLSELPP